MTCNMQKILHPQEVEVFYLLPAIRREMAIALKKTGKDQKQTAKILGVSEPSVSHYFNAQRATEVQFSDAIKKKIQKTAQALKTQQDTVKAVQKILKLIHKEKQMCKVCKDVNKALAKECVVCFD